ncbi:hypothetical protein L1987_54653 [Smallanthus sonchifolius]|uniref:Uncharacterized protein n=1 Tax=Smallanthus sonchifolius TaxID=185202 RepID=A0ACB9E7U1_9ASTR|nr:hypothetical protein L1987_54653 [Smallanthus sonchifolius]
MSGITGSGDGSRGGAGGHLSRLLVVVRGGAWAEHEAGGGGAGRTDGDRGGLSQVREEEVAMVMEEHVLDYDGWNGVPNEEDDPTDG